MDSENKTAIAKCITHQSSNSFVKDNVSTNLFDQWKNTVCNFCD